MSPEVERVRKFSTSPQRQPIGVVGLGDDAESPPEDVELVDEGRAHIGRQGVEEARDRHAEHLGPGPVDIGIDLRRRRIEKREDLGQAGRPIGRPRDRGDGLFERVRAAIGAVLHIQLETAAGADARAPRAAAG